MASSTGFFLLLPGGGPGSRRSGQRVCLLHGWLQSSEVWLTTAAALRDTYGHDVLLLDWWGHGRSRLRDAEDWRSLLTVDSLEVQLRSVLRCVGWDTGARVTVAGLSLGGALAARYAAAHPQRVARLVLVAAAGLDEQWWALSELTKPLNNWLAKPLRAALRALGGWDDLPGLRTLFAHLRLIEATPTYGVPPDLPQRLSSNTGEDGGGGGPKLCLVWGRFDWIHTSQVARWRGGRGAGDGAGEVPSLVLPWSGHVQVCHALDGLKLWQRAGWWTAEAGDGGGGGRERQREKEEEEEKEPTAARVAGGGQAGRGTVGDADMGEGQREATPRGSSFPDEATWKVPPRLGPLGSGEGAAASIRPRL